MLDKEFVCYALGHATYSSRLDCPLRDRDFCARRRPVRAQALAVDDRVAERYATFSAALSAIESQYVDKVESDRVVYSAIRGMLSTLDPHSSFFDPREYAQMRERQEGRYYGLGITIQSMNGDITAASVFEGSPAYKQGIRRGDVLVEDQRRGRQGLDHRTGDEEPARAERHVVTVDIRRRGYDAPIPLKVTRDEVQIPTVAAHFMIDATTGYIKHSDWGENTDREMQRALTDLRSKGMKRLLYDIRGNPGGPLDQAIKVSNEFLPKGKMIVYTRGRIRNSDQDYRATEDSTYLDIPMVVLANRNSASASEIFTGALQDHDRAYIVGETTFGKALVQSVYPISNGAGLALTTAHYFTPSDRLIQRPWDETFDEYLSYTQKDQDATRPHKAERSQKDRVRSPGLQRRRHRTRQVRARHDEGFNPTPFGARSGRTPGVRHLLAEVHRRRRHAHQLARWQRLGGREAQLQRRRPDAEGIPRAAGRGPSANR